MTKGEEKALGIAADEPGSVVLLMGVEAIARGALEAGVGVATAYPGTPSSELIDRLSKAAKKFNMYVEWSINEKVAVEIAGAASLSGVRAIAAMKQNGLSVALDFLSGLAYTGINKGIVFMVGDDAGVSRARMSRIAEILQRCSTCLFSSLQRTRKRKIWPNGPSSFRRSSLLSVSFVPPRGYCTAGAR